MTKSDLLIKLIDAHNKVVEKALDSFQERESWVESNSSYSDSKHAIPLSIHEYTQMFLINIKDILSVDDLGDLDVKLPDKVEEKIPEFKESLPKDFHTDSPHKL